MDFFVQDIGCHVGCSGGTTLSFFVIFSLPFLPLFKGKALLAQLHEVLCIITANVLPCCRWMEIRKAKLNFQFPI